MFEKGKKENIKSSLMLHGEKFYPCSKANCKYFEEWEFVDKSLQEYLICISLLACNCHCCIHFKGTDRFRRKEQVEK